MIARFFAAAVLAWMFGFVWFAGMPPGSAGPVVTDAVVVPTGAAGRIQRGLEVIAARQAQVLFVSGVDPDVTTGEFAAEYDVSPRTMRCCVALGYEARDTHGNAREIARWIADQDIRSVRLITHDWHMRRTAAELDRAVMPGVLIVRDAIPAHPGIGTLFLEYHKFLATWLRGVTGLARWPG